jgi:hypothetical protein
MKRALALFVMLEFAICLVSHSQSGPTGILQLQTNSKPWPANSTGIVNINAMIKEDFKIPKKPSPKLQINPTPEFEVKGETNFTEEGQGKDPEYFNAFKPMTLQVVATRTTAPGRYTLGGKLVYFYCSDKEKYCSRAVETVQIPIEIVAGK